MPTQEFLDCLFSFSLFPLISKPTRLTSHSATLIDNIFRNSVSSHKNGLIINDLSDHLPIFSVNCDLNLPKTNTNLTFTRNFSDKNISKFRDLLSNVKWTDINSHSDPNKAYNDFFNRYSNLYNSCFPLRPVKGQASRFLKTPWITPALLKSIRKKNLMYKKLVANYDSTRETKYKSYKNKLTHLIRISKKKYYEAKFEMAKNDVKATWKLMNELINTKKRKHSLPSSFLLNEKSIDDPVVIANSFCNYFNNIGPSLARKIPKTNKSHMDFMSLHNKHSIMVQPVTTEELENICKSFKSSKAPGYDNISMNIIKRSFDIISEPLKFIINLSLDKGIFPDNLKLAKVTPVFKIDDPHLITNYRPISLLPNFSKFFERMMHYRITAFLNEHNILSDSQFGFRKKHSTSLALIHLMNMLSTSIDNGKPTIGVFLDLSKAFDTLDHNILVSKLECYGIRGLCLDWIKSYLTNRKQFVQFNDSASTEQIITCGVPQGSILGPLFFILYINDFPKIFELANSMLFADDTSIFLSHKNPDQLVDLLNKELKLVDLWMKTNKLSVNIKKKLISYSLNPDKNISFLAALFYIATAH